VISGRGKWLASKTRRRIARAFFSRLYRDEYPETARTMMLAGTARSGTTWLGEILASQLPCRVMFEPFNPRKVAAYRGFEYFQYARPDADNPALERYCRTVFSGRIRDAWIDREVAHLRPSLRLVKEIRANLLLKWIARRFPEVPMLLVLRHPCAVVESRLRLNWATDSDIASFLGQSTLVADFLEDKLDLIASTDSAEGKHAIIWSISNLVPLRQFDAGALPIVFYENLCMRPGLELPTAFAALRQAAPADLARSLLRPSSTTTADSFMGEHRRSLSAWQDRLGAQRIDRILRIVDAFGLGELYDSAGMPAATGLGSARSGVPAA